MCKICKDATFAFQKLSDDEFFTSIVKNIDIKEGLNLRISPTSALKTLFNDLVGITRMIFQLIYHHQVTATINFLNLASLDLHKDELVTSQSLLEFEFDMIAVTETRIIAGIDPIYEVSVTGYNYYPTPTESEKGGVIIYVKNNIDVKRRTDLEKKMYKSSINQSIFIHSEEIHFNILIKK